MDRKQSGFTLLELIIVILLIAILAAIAVPKFINMAAQARVSQMRGIAAELQDAVVMVRSQWILQNDGAATTVDIDGVVVDVFAGTGWPVGDQTTVGGTLYTKLMSSAQPTSLEAEYGTAGAIYTFKGYTDCRFSYINDTGMVITPDVTVDNCD